MSIPIYEINTKILNLTNKITEKLVRFELTVNQTSNLQLRKVSKIKSVNSSCAIEQNNLSEEEVIDVINGKKVKAPINEIIEVKNAYEAYINIEKYNPYKVNDLLKAHKVITHGLINEAGVFRHGDVGVFDGNKVIHMGARPEFIHNLVNELFDWAKKSNLHPLIKSSIVHFEIEFIHPFSDGNGRIGRFWQSLILYNYNKVLEYLPIETLIYENQQAYYNALAKAEKEASATVFVEFVLEMILKTIDKFEITNKLDTLNESYTKDLSKSEKQVLNILLFHFEKDETVDIEKAITILNKSSTNIRKYYKRFTELNILIAYGKNKGRYYKLNKEIFSK